MYFRILILTLCLGLFSYASYGQINFSQSELDFDGNGDVDAGVTSMMYGPDGRLYVAEYPGTIKILTIQRISATDYKVTSVESLSGVKDIVNYDDDGTACSGTTDNCSSRETTGLTVGGTAANPVIYVASSDFRIGAGTGGGNGDVDLDTNSGIITRLSWNGSSWDVVDLVRGLPRSEENHATNGLELATINGTDYLIVASGGITNGGAPSTNFVYTCEYALSAAILSIDLDAINALPIQTDGNGRDYIYDIPTLDDPSRANVNGITDPDNPSYNGIDVNDPFGGNDGLNQAVVVPGGPVQIYSPGYRNAYDIVLTENGALYATDNGANQGWGGFPVNEGGGSVTNDYDPAEPGSQSSSGGEQINNLDHLELITNNIQTYTSGSFYGGHPNPVRANPNGAGLFTAPDQTGTTNAVFRTQIYDPDGSTQGSTTDPTVGLPANWPPVATANPIEGDWRGPGINNPDGPDDNPIVTWGTNTNGIDEYTATNFSGAMQGNLLAGVSNGVIRRVELQPNGTLDNFTSNFLSGIGGNALGITCNSDAEVFPGTIWAGTLNGKIVVFEPQDFVECLDPGDPGYDPNADYDFDGYTNQDEEDNGTDPCNGGSQPQDFDKSAGAPLVSDLNDLDDDNDGINDANDPMQLGDPDTGGSDAFVVPVSNDLFNDQQGLGGIFGLGMTGLMNNGDPNPNWLEWLDEKGQGPNPDDVLGGAPGLMTSHMTSGTCLGNTNTQEKGYQYGVQVDQNTGKFSVIGNLIGLTGPLRLYGNTAAVGGELGHFIGDGTQSNYIKIVLTVDGITALQEINDVPQTPININIPVGNRPTSDIVFYFGVDPSNGEVDLEYAIDGGNKQTIGTITAQGSILQAIQQANSDLMVGFTGTSGTVGVELEGTWDFLNVIGEVPIVAEPMPDLERLVSSPDEDIDLDQYFDDDNGVGNLTYSVESNTNPSIGATINSNTLTISYPASPANSDITIRATDADTNFVEQTFNVDATDQPIVLYRVNSGGPQLTAIDGGLDWEVDQTSNNSQYLTEPGTNDSFPSSTMPVDGSVNQATTPLQVFASERYDNIPGTPNLTYSFPVSQDGNYEIRLYMGNSFAGTSQPEERIFDVEIEGVVLPLLDNVDLSATYGHQVGTMISHILNINDGSIDISFVHGVIENPLINAIEILDVPEDETPIYVHPIADQLSVDGQQLNGSLGVIAYGGDGNLQYSATGLPPSITIEPTNGQIGGTIDANASAGSPYNVSVTVDDMDGTNTDAVTINFVWNVLETAAVRVNAGGFEVASTDIGLDWEDNSQSGSQTGVNYSVNTGAWTFSGILFEDRHPSIPGYIDSNTFAGLFARERFDRETGPEMEYTFALGDGDYVVNVYMGNAFAGTSQIGQRVFDILLEGNVVRNNLDLIAEFGHEAAGMLSFPVTVSDGALNLGFGHEVENPLLNAIEIYEIDPAFPTLTLDAIADQTNGGGEQANLTASGNGGNPGESFYYYMSGQPEGVDIDLNSGQITGTISTEALTGGPNGDGVHITRVSVLKPGSAPATQVFNWTITPPTEWTDKDEDENYTARHECSFVQAGDKFYVMGGRENATTLDVYDYATDSWTSLVDSAPVEFNHYQAVEYQGLIWVIGAFKTNTFPNEAPADFIWAFDPANEEWIQGPEIPSGRKRGSAGLAMYNNKFYILAGNTVGHNGGYVEWFDEYDPATGTWTTLPDAPRARDHFHAEVIGDKLYAAGGRLSGGSGGVWKPLIAEVDVYDFSTGTWSTLPSAQNIPTPRAAASTANFNGKLLVIGGEVEDELVYGVLTDDALAITEQYDPGTNTWSRLGDLNFKRHGTQAIVSGNGVFVTGGSPNRGGGNQLNMEFLGVDSPVGNPSTASTLSAPSTVVIADGGSEDIDLDVMDGNLGIIVRSMEITGPNAADFSIDAGELQNALLNANSTSTVTVSLSGTGENRSATLTINYGSDESLSIILTNNEALVFSATNPGPQYNYEGDNVTLQIEATSPNTLSFSATNLPPDLTINPNTGVISGQIDDGFVGGGGDDFIEQNGLLIVDAESGNIVPNWSQTTTGGATGIIAGSNHFNNQNGGTIPYQVTISTPGVYRFNWRSFFSGSDPTEENDNWLRFPNDNDVWFFGIKGAVGDEASIIANLQGAQNNIVFPKGSSRVTPETEPEGNGGNGYFKVFRSGGQSEVYKWQALTSDNDSHKIYVWFVNPGTYTFEISERSLGHAIDRVALYKIDTFGDTYDADNFTNAPESPQGGGSSGPGASENSPYAVEVVVTDNGNPPNSETLQFNWIIGEPGDLIAAPEADPLSGEAPLLVQFTGSNSLDDVGITSYLWDFDDGGNTSTEADPQYTFTQAGNYDVSLTVEDADGNTDTNSITIMVTAPVNEPPVAVAEATPTSGSAPLEVTFTGSNSTDDGTIVSYFWDFKDGGSSNEADPVYTFNAGGTYDVELTVTDDGGLEDTDIITITVDATNLPPTAVAEADPTSGMAPLTVNFTGSNSTDDVGIVSYSWDFDDGNSSTDADPTHVFTDPGTYVVELTVEDTGGLTDTDTITIVVSDPSGNEPPVAVAEADTTEGDAPLTVNFTGSNSTDDQGVVSYSWNFDDGGNTSTEADPTYTFTSPGTYQVTLTVSDAGDLTDTDTITIIVNDPNGNQPPVAVIQANPTEGIAPLEVEFNGQGSTDDVGIVSYAWDFGDGTNSDLMNPIHTFTDPGEFTVSLTVTDNGGLSNTTTIAVIVTEMSDKMMAIILENPTQEGMAKIQVVNRPSNIVVLNIYLHDNTGRLIAAYDAQQYFTSNETFEIPVMTVRDGLYFIGLEMNQGDPLLVKIFVKN